MKRDCCCTFDCQGCIDLEKLEKAISDDEQNPNLSIWRPIFTILPERFIPKETKLALIDILKDKNIPLIEDDAYSDLYFYEEDKPHLTTIKAMNPEGIDVCYTGSFSKILGPGLRLGWMLVPEAIYQKAELIKQAIDACSPSFTQMLAHKFWVVLFTTI